MVQGLLRMTDRRLGHWLLGRRPLVFATISFMLLSLSFISYGASGELVTRLWKSPNLNDGDNDEPYGLALADYDGDGILDIWAGDSNSTVMVFSGDDYERIANFTMSEGMEVINTLEIVDLDGDGGLELVIGYGDYWSGGVCVIDISTGIERFLNSTIGSVFALDAADTDDDGRLELVVAGSGFIEKVYVYDGRTFTLEWNSTDLNGDLPSLIAGDVNFDGEVEIWVGVEAIDDQYDYYGEIQVLRGRDGVLLWNRTDFYEPVLALDYDSGTVWVGTGEMGDEIFDYNGRIYGLNSSTYVEETKTGDFNHEYHAIWHGEIQGQSGSQIVVATEEGINRPTSRTMIETRAAFNFGSRLKGQRSQPTADHRQLPAGRTERQPRGGRRRVLWWRRASCARDWTR